MPYLIDGSNVLGAMKADRHSDGAKRELVRLLGAFARAKRTRITCVFDGAQPDAFGKLPASVSVAFSGAAPADDLIAARAAHGRGWIVVTSDRGLSARVQRRHVTLVAPATFVRDLEAAASGDESGEGDWEAYFSDPKNRLKF